MGSEALSRGLLALGEGLMPIARDRMQQEWASTEAAADRLHQEAMERRRNLWSTQAQERGFEHAETLTARGEAFQLGVMEKEQGFRAGESAADRALRQEEAAASRGLTERMHTEGLLESKRQAGLDRAMQREAWGVENVQQIEKNAQAELARIDEQLFDLATAAAEFGGFEVSPEHAQLRDQLMKQRQTAIREMVYGLSMAGDKRFPVVEDEGGGKADFSDVTAGIEGLVGGSSVPPPPAKRIRTKKSGGGVVPPPAATPQAASTKPGAGIVSVQEAARQAVQALRQGGKPAPESLEALRAAGREAALALKAAGASAEELAQLQGR